MVGPRPTLHGWHGRVARPFKGGGHDDDHRRRAPLSAKLTVSRRVAPMSKPPSRGRGTTTGFIQAPIRRHPRGTRHAIFFDGPHSCPRRLRRVARPFKGGGHDDDHRRRVPLSAKLTVSRCPVPSRNGWRVAVCQPRPLLPGAASTLPASPARGVHLRPDPRERKLHEHLKPTEGAIRRRALGRYAMSTEGSHERGGPGWKIVAVLLGALALYLVWGTLHSLWRLVSDGTFEWDGFFFLVAFSVVVICCAVYGARTAVLLWAGASPVGIRRLSWIVGATCCILVSQVHRVASPLLPDSLPFFREFTWVELFSLLGLSAGMVAYHLCRKWCTALVGMPETATRAANTRSAKTVMLLFCFFLFSTLSSVMMDVWPTAPGFEWVPESPGTMVSFLGSIALAIVVYRVSARIIDRRADKRGEPMASIEQAGG